MVATTVHRAYRAGWFDGWLAGSLGWAGWLGMAGMAGLSPRPLAGLLTGRLWLKADELTSACINP